MKDYKSIIKNIGMDKLILMAVAGIILVVCSISGTKVHSTSENSKSNIEQSSEKQEETISMDEYTQALEKRLCELIENIDGVSDVHVMITLKKSESREILKDENVTSETTNESDGTGGERVVSSFSKNETTIYITNEQGEEVPYILSSISPQIEGVAVVAQGGENVVVKEKIINLIKALFGIEINKIMVTV